MPAQTSARFQYQGQTDPLQAITPDLTQRPAGGGVGLLFPLQLHQYQALTGPVTIPTVVAAPALAITYGELPVRRLIDIRDTRSTEFGRADIVPTLAAQPMPDLMRPRPLTYGLSHQEVLQPPPFTPTDVAATLTQSPPPPRRTPSIALRAFTPVGPPSSAIPPAGLPWVPLPNQPPARALPRPQQLTRAQNLVPIAPTGAPNGSWYPEADLPVRRPKFLVAWQWFAQNISPISTPAYLSSFWDTYRVTGPFPKGGLLTALQQAAATLPLEDIVIVLMAPWKPSIPDYLWARPRLKEYPSGGTLQSISAIASGIGCIIVSTPGVTESTLFATDLTESTLGLPGLTASTLLDPEVC